jgi:hypothetical protein
VGLFKVAELADQCVVLGIGDQRGIAAVVGGTVEVDFVYELPPGGCRIGRRLGVGRVIVAEHELPRFGPRCALREPSVLSGRGLFHGKSFAIWCRRRMRGGSLAPSSQIFLQ